MTQRARIKLTGTDHKILDDICKQIKVIGPTKKLKVPVMKTPCGSGTGHGNATWDKWEMRIHKRVMEVGADQRTLRQIMRIEIPENVSIQIELKE
jgi:small subunit ribosomal protein S10